MRLLPTIISALTLCSSIAAQPKQLILHQEEGRVTFAVDEVTPTEKPCGYYAYNGYQLIQSINPQPWVSDWKATIIYSSLIDPENSYYNLDQDVVFQMLIKAWCEHRPVELSPDVIWLLICQQFNHYANNNHEALRAKLVSNPEKKEFSFRTDSEFGDQLDWDDFVRRVVSQISSNTKDSVAAIITSDFTTTGNAERIASQVVLQGVAKPDYYQLFFNMICGIPSITLTGTPSDWRKVLAKTLALRDYGLDWWIDDLKPILEEFVAASEGHPDYWFWKDIVCKTRPRKIKGPSCSKRNKKRLEFDGWFLKLFPFDDEGRTGSTANLYARMLPETVCVPFKYVVEDSVGDTISETPMDFIAGILGVREDDKHTLIPVIGWFVSTTLPEEERAKLDNTIRTVCTVGPQRTWDKGPLTWDDFSGKPNNPNPFNLRCGISKTYNVGKSGNLKYSYISSHTQMSPSGSWCRDYYRDSTSLLYLQTSFNYWEVLRRKTQKDIFSGIKSDFSDAIKEGDEHFNEIREDTRNGRDSAAVRFWADVVSAELRTTEDPQPDVPVVKYKGSAFGMHVGVELGVNTSGFSKYIGKTPNLSIPLGFGLMFNRVLFEWEGAMIAGKCNKDFQVGKDIWEKGEYVPGMRACLNFGYALYDSDRLRITPFAGIGLINYNYQPKSWEEEGREGSIFTGSRECFGLYFDIKLSRSLNSLYSKYTIPRGAPLGEVMFRPYISVSHTQFGPVPSPWTFSFGVSWNFLYWSLKE